MNRINVPEGNPYFEGTKVLDGNTYKLVFRWNTTSEKWYMDIIGISNDVDVRGIACLGGKDLLRIHGYSELGQLWIIDNLGSNEDPTYESFGGRHTVEYIPLT